VKIKSRYPYYVRLINDEILHVITFKEDHDYTFTILCGVATVYRKEINLSGKPVWNWFRNLFNMYEYTNKFKPRKEVSKLYYDLNYIRYMPYREIDKHNFYMIESFEYALNMT